MKDRQSEIARIQEHLSAAGRGVSEIQLKRFTTLDQVPLAGGERESWTSRTRGFALLAPAPSCLALTEIPHLPFITINQSCNSASNYSIMCAASSSPHLWNQLPASFRQPCTKHPADDVTLSNSPSTYSPLSPSITHSLFHNFHSRLKTHLFHKSFPP